MPINKSAFLRYRIIDACLTNKMRRYPKLENIIERIESNLGTSISASMFNKDIHQMKAIYNAPIKYDRYQKGYCYTEEDFSIREFPLTEDEVEALDMSTALLQQLKGTRIFSHFESAINKVIVGYRISSILGKSENQLLQVEEPVKSEGSPWLEPILKAIIQKECVQLSYQPFGKDEAIYDVSPYLLKEYRNRWYLTGYSSNSKAIRTFALDRVKNIKESYGKYNSGIDFSPTEFFKYSFGITQLENAKPSEIILSFTKYQAPYILSQPMHHSQRVLDNNERELLIQLNVYMTSELKMSILSYGAEVKVISPLELREEIKQMIREMGDRY